MRKQNVIEHFGSQAALARALGVKPQSVDSWGETVPPLRQIQIEKLTGGKFKAGASVFATKPADGGIG